MLVAHSLEAIFLHVRKSAGSSIELGLATLCGPKDIITLRHHDDIRAQINARAPQNLHIPLSRLTPSEWASCIRHRKRPTYRNHASAAELKRIMGGTWDAYFKFASERNPWDKAVSHYFWDTVRPDRTYEVDLSSFSSWLRTCPLEALTQFDTYAIDGGVAVDRVVFFESLHEDLASIWRKLGVSEPPIPHVKGEPRPAWSRDYRIMYSDADAERVAKVCRREIGAFGYSFD